jgi:hypothetical protein
MHRPFTPELSDTICFPFSWGFRIVRHCETPKSGNNKLNTAYLMSLPRRLVAGIPPCRAWLYPCSWYVGFVVDHEAMGRVCHKHFSFLTISHCTDRSIFICQRELAHWTHKCTAYQVEPVWPLHTNTEEDTETDMSLITTYFFPCKIYVK